MNVLEQTTVFVADWFVKSCVLAMALFVVCGACWLVAWARGFLGSVAEIRRIRRSARVLHREVATVLEEAAR